MRADTKNPKHTEKPGQVSDLPPALSFYIQAVFAQPGDGYSFLHISTYVTVCPLLDMLNALQYTVCMSHLSCYIKSFWRSGIKLCSHLQCLYHPA